jgi:hypothetical protein
MGWLREEAVWIDMLDSGNTTSHEDLEAGLAEDNYDDIRKVAPTLSDNFRFASCPVL